MRNVNIMMGSSPIQSKAARISGIKSESWEVRDKLSL
jgi:hypothetical protein